MVERLRAHGRRRARRLALARPSTGTTARRGRPRSTASSAAYVSYYPDLAVAGRGRDASARSRALAAARGVRAAGAALRPRRARGAARRAGADRAPAPSGRSCAAAGSRRTSARRSCSTASLAGEVALPAGDVPEPFVDVEDIADVAVAALTEDGHHGQVYELTGPRALRFDEAVAEIAAATGRDAALRAGAGRGVPRRDARGRRAGGRGRARHVPLQRGARRAQRAAAGRRAARAGPRAARLRRVRRAPRRPGAWA